MTQSHECVIRFFLYRAEQDIAHQLRQQMLEIKSREEEAILLEHEQALLLKEKLALEKAVSYHILSVSINGIIVFNIVIVMSFCFRKSKENN